ncbi:MAG: 4'-phosphopantetheinyl transferase superfamily protein [Candidatus Sulfotelmatobacter sp.]
MGQIKNIADSSFQIGSLLPLPEDEVQLWRIDLEALGVDESRWQGVLSADEAARASRFHFARDRQRFVAARALLRIILASYLETDASSLRFSYSKKEKPSLGSTHARSDVRFNITHSSGVALLAFTRGREIGVDVEQVRHDFDPGAIARRYFSTHEQNQLAGLPVEQKVEAFFRCWTRKEAYIKATGDGLSLPLSQFDVSLAAGDGNALLATRPDGSEAAGWLLQEVPAGPGYVGALCARGRGWKLNDWSADIREIKG